MMVTMTTSASPRPIPAALATTSDRSVIRVGDSRSWTSSSPCSLGTRPAPSRPTNPTTTWPARPAASPQTTARCGRGHRTLRPRCVGRLRPAASRASGARWSSRVETLSETSSKTPGARADNSMETVAATATSVRRVTKPCHRANGRPPGPSGVRASRGPWCAGGAECVSHWFEHARSPKRRIGGVTTASGLPVGVQVVAPSASHRCPHRWPPRRDGGRLGYRVPPGC